MRIKNIFSAFESKHQDLETAKPSGVLNVHRLNTKNVGDLASAPYLYFPRLGDKILDIVAHNEGLVFNDWLSEIKNSHVVVGGGGFLERKSFKKSMNTFLKMSQKGKKIVYWGLGHNNPKFEKGAKYSEGYSKDFSDIDLFGTRDQDGYEWVPCASCMSDLFDEIHDVQQAYGIVMHYNSPFENVNNYPVIYNNESFEKTIAFIGKSDCIITNSYHALYWAILMKKKVIAIPNSSKMYGFKYPVPVCRAEDIDYVLHKTVIYNEALDICRNQNIAFAEKAYDYLQV